MGDDARMSRRRFVAGAAPWEAPDAAGLDGQSLETWVRANTTGGKRFRDLTATASRAIFGAEPRGAVAAVRALLHRGLG